MPRRSVHLLIYTQGSTKRPVPAHWAIFIPSLASTISTISTISTTSNTSTTASSPSTQPPPNPLGTKIHTIGSPFHGYTLSITPFDLLNPPSAGGKFATVLLGSLRDGGLADVDVDANLAALARTVPTPGVSDTPRDAFAGENCQHWLRKYVDLLISDAGLEAEAREVLGNAPTV